MDTHIWYEMDVSYPYKWVSEFFDEWGCGTREHTERFSDIENPSALVCKTGELKASSIEDLPERLVIAVTERGYGCGLLLILEPIKPKR